MARPLSENADPQNHEARSHSQSRNDSGFLIAHVNVLATSPLCGREQRRTMPPVLEMLQSLTSVGLADQITAIKRAAQRESYRSGLGLPDLVP
jgi:hypothetical protein